VTVDARERSRLDPNAFAKYAIRSDPSVHQAPVVSNLEALAVDRIDEVQVFIPAYFT